MPVFNLDVPVSTASAPTAMASLVRVTPVNVVRAAVQWRALSQPLLVAWAAARRLPLHAQVPAASA